MVKHNDNPPPGSGWSAYDKLSARQIAISSALGTAAAYLAAAEVQLAEEALRLGVDPKVMLRVHHDLQDKMGAMPVTALEDAENAPILALVGETILKEFPD